MNLFVSRNAVGFTFGVHHKATDDLRENVSLFHINRAMCRLSSLIKRDESDTLKQHQCEFILILFVNDRNILSNVIC